MSKADQPRIVAVDELPQHLSAAFSHLYSMECEKAALIEEHIKSVSEEITASWRDLKAGTGVDRATLKPYYELYKRGRIAQDMADEAEGVRVQRDLKRVYLALDKGKTLNFLEVLMAPPAAVSASQSKGQDNRAPADGEGAQGASKADGGGQAKEQKQKAAKPEAAREEAADHKAKDPDLDNAGHFYNEGEAAGLAGHGPEVNKYADGSMKARQWEMGRAMGFKKLQAQQSKSDAPARQPETALVH
jgi:hypothetical protein